MRITVLIAAALLVTSCADIRVTRRAPVVVDNALMCQETDFRFVTLLKSAEELQASLLKQGDTTDLRVGVVATKSETELVMKLFQLGFLIINPAAGLTEVIQ